MQIKLYLPDKNDSVHPFDDFQHFTLFDILWNYEAKKTIIKCLQFKVGQIYRVGEHVANWIQFVEDLFEPQFISYVNEKRTPI